MGHPKYFLGIELHIKKHSVFFPSKSMLWIFWRKQDFWDASLLILQWKPMWIYDLMTVIRLMIQEDIWDWLGSWSISRLLSQIITFALSILSRFMHQLRETRWLAAIRILAYIKSCLKKVLVYRKHEHVRIFGFSDSDYAGDRGDKKSTSYCTFVRGNLVTCRSKKQDVSLEGKSWV